jgi:predicted transcriptional regulator
MSVIKVEKNTNFVVMSNEFLRNKELSLKAKGLLAMILSLPPEWNYSINGLVAICKENITAVRNSLKELEEHGHVVIEKKKNEKGHFVYNYTIYESPIDLPVQENLVLDNVDMGKQHLDNQHQLNKDILSTKEKVLNNNLYILDERLSPEISKLFKEYIKMREEEKMPVSERGLQTLLNRLEKLSNNNVNVQKIMLSNATLNKWKNLYKPSDQEIEAFSKALVESLKSFYHI